MRGGGTVETTERLNGEGLVVVGGVMCLLLDVWVLYTSFAPSPLALRSRRFLRQPRDWHSYGARSSTRSNSKYAVCVTDDLSTRKLGILGGSCNF